MSIRRPDGGDALVGALIAAIAVLSAEIAAGAAVGFDRVLPHLCFWALLGLLVAPAWWMARAASRAEPVDAAVRAAVLAFATVVAIGLTLGAAGLMTPVWYACAELAVLAAAMAIRGRAAALADASCPYLAAGVWVALVAFVVGMGLANSPLTAYDAVSYHLFFPARWLQAQRLFIVPTPFGDAAQAYQPGNGELWFLWLMLPFHGDFLARVGQLPFYLLGAAVSYLLALRCGVARPHAAYAPTLWLATPTIVEQAVGANVDLVAAAMFVAAVYFAVVAVDTRRRRDWALWGIATGLFIGTKYLAVVYAPLLAAIPIVRRPGARVLWGLPGILALGAPWYVRNWIVAGSPLYPATLSVGGIALGRGAYTHAAMLQSFMHTTEPRLLLVALVHAFGAPYFVVFAPIAVAAVARTRTWPAWGVAAALAGGVALCWLMVGDNTDARFLLPAVALLPALVPVAFGADRRLNGLLHAWLGGGIAWVLIGMDRRVDWSLPWFMSDWLRLHGVLDPRFVLLFAALAVTAAFACRAAARRGRLVGAAIVLTVAAGAALAGGALRWCRGGHCDYVAVADPHIRPACLYGARWLTEHVHGARVAYCGINLPYLLCGPHLTNIVSYVNIDSHRSWRFDHYAAAYRRGGMAPGAPRLAEPSGVLLPARTGDDAVRPRFERRAGDRDQWKANLAHGGIAYLFVATLDPYEIDYSWHDAQGFPVEDAWARSDPATFRLAYENEQVRVYEVIR